MPQKVVIAGEDDALLLPLRWDTRPSELNLRHLLRPIDAPKVTKIVSTLMDRGFSTYFAGSVVSKYLFAGAPVSYHDVDIVASASIREVRNLVEMLEAVPGRTTTLFDYSIPTEVEGERIHVPVRFDVKINSPKGMYIPHTPTREIVPFRYSVSVKEPKESRVSPIDLILISRADLKKGLSLG